MEDKTISLVISVMHWSRVWLKMKHEKLYLLKDIVKMMLRRLKGENPPEEK